MLDIGKVLPGRYQAARDISTLPKLSSLKPAAQKMYTGNLFVYDPNNQHSNDPRQQGFVKRHYRNGQVVAAQDTFTPFKGENPSLVVFLKTVPGGADIRVCPENFQTFSVDVPKDVAKLKGFTGTLKGIVFSRKRSYLITIGYKNGMAIMTSKVAMQRPPGK